MHATCPIQFPRKFFSKAPYKTFHGGTNYLGKESNRIAAENTINKIS
ncbi:hypothetical protein DB42_EA00580 [Neochlamydia sp. EPS4]|nr:hypothetical protein DB42_EA00580 [Neochlamydia sp. EPS4]